MYDNCGREVNPFIHGVSTLVVFHGGGGSIWPNNFDTHFNTELYTLDFWNFIGIITGYIKSEKKIYPPIFLKGGGSRGGGQILFFFWKNLLFEMSWNGEKIC